MNDSHMWAAVIGGIIVAFFTVVCPLLADLRPFSAERRWSRLQRQQRRDIARLAKKGTR